MKRVNTIWISASTIRSASQTTDSERVNSAMMHDSAISGRWTYWPRNLDSPSLMVMSSPTSRGRKSSTRTKEITASTKPTRNTDQNEARMMKAASSEYASAPTWSGRCSVDAIHTTANRIGAT